MKVAIMKATAAKNIKSAGLPAAVVGLAIFAGAWAGEALDPRIEAMMARDLNGDGALTEDEAPPGMFSLLDVDGNGRAEPAEIQALLGQRRTFAWVNPPEPGLAHPRLTHATFESPSMQMPVGYNIYLPVAYAERADARFPVIYYLHGGRPGSESRSAGLVRYIDDAVERGIVRPMIVVWVNGGEVSHYNHGKSKGEDVFVKELIPHVDRTYRTIAHRGGRALQGFSQGGRGTTRIMFRYPELFVSAAPGGPGYAVERQISENDGVEQDSRVANAPALDFGRGNDAYSLARAYAQDSVAPPLSIMIWVGNKGFNYEATLEYLGFLYGLGIAVERLVAPNVDHNPMAFYAARGDALLKFHDRHWTGVY